jgi:multicomponent Na+:H+ antiporter subunit B
MREPAALEHAQGEPHVQEPLHRPWLSLGCALGMLAVLVFGLLALPREDAPLPAIARYAIQIALPRWHITDVVNEIVYGTRGFDTFGETFLLLGAVVSVATLARQREPRAEYVGEEAAGEQEQRESDPDRSGSAGRGDGDGDRDGDGGSGLSDQEARARRAELEEAGEDTAADDAAAEDTGRDTGGDTGDLPDDAAERLPGSQRERYAADLTPLGSTAPEHSEAMTVIVRVAARIAAVILAVAAVYLCARGYTPGGGFPGGAALAGVGLLLYAALGYRTVSRVLRPQVLEPLEMIGALIVAALAVVGFFLQGAVLANWLPLAPQQTIASGGLLQAFSVTELLEVATGLSIAIFAMLTTRDDWTPDEPSGAGTHHDDPASGVGQDGAGSS